MPRDLKATLIRSLTNRIHHSQREVAVLFTDIEGSTRFWDKHGNVKGRLMVDRHNRLLTPIVSHFHGRVVKTIGDAIMARFDTPHQALQAAIAMQQSLEQERERDDDFDIHIRIGIHHGEAVVEQDDLFGDVVNVAARIVNEAERDEILISGRLSQRSDKKSFPRQKKGSFVPRGKRQRVALFRILWRQLPDLLESVQMQSRIPLGLSQRIETLLYLILSMLALYALHLHHLRYLFSDNESLALLLLNPGTMMWRHWYLSLPLLIFAAIILWRGLRVSSVPTRLLKAVKGCAVAGTLFILLQGISGFIPSSETLAIDRSVHSSHHLFVEINAPQAAIRQQPNSESDVLLHVSSGTLLLLANVRRIDGVIWNRVLIDNERHGWVERIQPAAIGKAQTRISRADIYRLRYRDLLVIVLSLCGVVWGYRSFHVKPQ